MEFGWAWDPLTLLFSCGCGLTRVGVAVAVVLLFTGKKDKPPGDRDEQQ